MLPAGISKINNDWMVTDVYVETLESPEEPAANVFSLCSTVIGLSRSLTATFERLINIRRFNFEKISLWSDVLISSGNATTMVKSMTSLPTALVISLMAYWCDAQVRYWSRATSPQDGVTPVCAADSFVPPTWVGLTEDHNNCVKAC